MVFTTNKAPANWGNVLSDEDLGVAIVDRILELAEYQARRPSIRSKHVDLRPSGQRCGTL